MRKIVVNRTDHRWQRYEIELREDLDQQSDYGDGLSFAQGAVIDPASIALHVANRGQVAPGDTVAITGAGAIGLLGGDAARKRTLNPLALLPELDRGELHRESARQLRESRPVHRLAVRVEVAEEVVANQNTAG